MLKVIMKSWIPTLSLSLAAFIFVTSEFIPVGLLPEIAQGFGRTEAETGLLMTGYAWIVALMSVPLTIASARFNRRSLMLIFISLFVVAHAVSASAPTFSILAFSRFAVAIAHSVFWAIAIPLGVRLAPPGKRDRAISVVATGATLGGILGVPLGTYIGEGFGWRFALGGIGGVAFAIGLVLFATLPSSPSRQVGGSKSVGPIFRRRSLIYIYLLTLVIMTGHYGVFTFINPYLLSVGSLPKDLVASILLAFGVGGLVGGLAAPDFMRRGPVRFALISLALVGLALLTLPLAVSSYLSTILLVFVWGAMFSAFNLVLQSLVLNIASDAEDVAMAAFSGIFNLGIGSGALTGSLCSPDHLIWTGYIGTALMVTAFAMCVYLARRISFVPAHSI